MNNKLTLIVQVAIYCNENGYAAYGKRKDIDEIKKICGNGMVGGGIDKVTGEGFLVSLRANDGIAILSEYEVSGNRKSQKNVGVLWKGDVPMEYLPDLERAMSELDYTQVGTQKLTLSSPTRLPKPSPYLIAGMRAALDEECRCVVRGSDCTARDLLAAADRLVLTDGRLSMALPLPAGGAHQQINLYPGLRDFKPEEIPERLIWISSKAWPEGITKEERELARCMAEASEQIVDLAKELGSERVYLLYHALRRNIWPKPVAGDERLLTEILNSISEEDLNGILARLSPEEKTRVILGEFRDAASTGSHSYAREKRAPRRSRLRGFLQAVGRGISRFVHSRKVHFAFCLLLTVLLLACGSADLTPETVILFQDGSELVTAVIALIWGLFLGAGFGRRADRRGAAWEREGREEWEEDSGE